MPLNVNLLLSLLDFGRYFILFQELMRSGNCCTRGILNFNRQTDISQFPGGASSSAVVEKNRLLPPQLLNNGREADHSPSSL
ncbi:MAG TPA: hypothetical protein VHA52_08520, partial [Candidatus Babeliaceae bacterium]|nr:hypothetical protein [Candidatus Babeliaceae bacterium]